MAVSVSRECSHYDRNCLFLTPCCDKIYKCRLCHDESEDHKLVRKLIECIICAECGNLQPVQKYCGECGTQFGIYTCLKCRLYDNTMKGQFHCDYCGICRLGGRENFFHCNVCNLCLNLNLRNNHKCVENASLTNCPICVEEMHSSVEPLYVPKCGHLLHEKCYNLLKDAGRNNCSLCEAPMQ